MLKKLKLPQISLRKYTPLFYYLLMVVLMWLVVSFPYFPHNLNLEIGQIAPKTIIAPRHIILQTTEDLVNSDLSHTFSRKSTEKVYVIDSVISNSVSDEIRGFFSLIKELKEQPNLNIETLPEEFNFIPKSNLLLLLHLDMDDLKTLEYFTLQHANDYLDRGIFTVNNSELFNDLESEKGSLRLGKDQRETSLLILLKFLRPNLKLSPEKTKALSHKNGADTQNITEYKERQPIVYGGEMISKKHLEVFKALGIMGIEYNWLLLGGLLLTVSFFLLLLERFIHFFNPRICENYKNLLLIYMIILGGLINGIMVHHLNALPFMIDQRFLIPIPIAAMLISLLLRTNISMLAGTVLSVFIAIIFKFDLSTFIFLFLSNAVTIFLAYKKYLRRDLILVGYLVGVANIVLVVTLGLLSQQSIFTWYLSNGLVSFFCGVLSSMACLAMMPYLENMFNISTRQTLLDFSNLNHPLLKQLMISAPGTYQHSLMVAILAEAAAEAIQADPLICRVGAYFHDIGKIKRPLFFSENQHIGDNPHDSLAPKLSKMIIASHIKDGLELAVKHKLPDVVKDIISQHHGTTLVSFFFIQAKQTASEKGSEIIEEDFRYPGPKPLSKEAGIMMLADSAEAATRSMDKPSYSKIENMVEKIFAHKIETHQLDQCPLSLREINIIKEVFLSLFKGIYHHRLDYEEELTHILEQHKNTHGK